MAISQPPAASRSQSSASRKKETGGVEWSSLAAEDRGRAPTALVLC